ncbi:DUF4097 family beta strand repeat-containing protein [Micromonospora sp. NPDC050417]|uniref:DUF4097 family beta strand repeat-containing protein n=1 Tax=Micromonospora sp. NPDC050417 TaxID=3364280 RepID=UPI003791DDC7
MNTFRTVSALTAGALALGLLAACNDSSLGERRLDFDQTEAVKINKITVAPGAGDVVVSTGAVDTVRIKRVIRYRGAQPSDDTFRIDGTELRIDTECGSSCSVSYDILAPTGVAVGGENGSGDVSLSDVGDVDVKVGSGDVTLARVTGTVRAETGSGDINLRRVEKAATVRTGSGSVTGDDLGSTVEATTGSGDITLAIRTAGSVKAHASSGSIGLTVPQGAYRVEAHSSSGTTRSDLQTDPAASHLLDLETASGDITLTRR